MVPPQTGQFQSEGGWSAAGDFVEAGISSASWSKRKQSGRSSARRRLARKPKLRIRTKPRGSRWSRKQVIDAAESDPSLATRRFADTTLLHFAAGAGCLEVVALLLRLGVDPNIKGRGRTALYCLANECASETGPEVVRALARGGADVNACSGVTQATALHMAARRGHVEIARALLDSGAAVNARNHKGDTPLQRAISCRKDEVSQLLLERGAH